MLRGKMGMLCACGGHNTRRFVEGGHHTGSDEKSLVLSITELAVDGSMHGKNRPAADGRGLVRVYSESVCC